MPYNPQLHSHQHLHHHHQSLPRGNNVGGGNFLLRDSSPAGTNSSSNTTSSSNVTYQPLPAAQQQQQQQQFPGYPQYNTQHRLPTVSSGVYEKRPPLASRNGGGYPGARPSYTTLGPPRSGSALGGAACQASKQFDSYYYHPATLKPNYQNSNATSHTNSRGGRLDYADLSIQQQQQHLHPPTGRGNTDYAVLQFNKNSDVGKEIDV